LSFFLVWLLAAGKTGEEAIKAEEQRAMGKKGVKVETADDEAAASASASAGE
jgi:hypothetical protein